MTRLEFDSRSTAVNRAILKKLPWILAIPIGALIFFFEYARHFARFVGPNLRFWLPAAVILGGAFGMSVIMSRLMKGASRRAGLVCPFCDATLGGYVKAVRETHRCPSCSKSVIDSALPVDRGAVASDFSAAIPAGVSCLPLRFTPNRMKQVRVLLGAVALAFCGVLVVREHPLAGYFGIGLFGLGAIVIALNFHPQSAYLVVDVGGFTYASLFRRHFVPSSQIEGFVPAQVRRARMVGWNYTDQHRRTRALRKVNSALSGAEAALPDTYGRSVPELIELLEGYRAKYSRDAVQGT